MARNYQRDSKGRFSGTGGGGKIGKSAKNVKARAKYKEAASKLRETEKIFGGKSSAVAKRSIAGAKSGLTRVTKNLRGGKAVSAASTKPKATPKPKAAAKPKAPRGMDGPQRRTKASTIAAADANARLDAGRRLRGAGKNPTARAERNLERGMAGSGRKARKTESTAKRAIDFMASQGTLGKRGKRRS